MKKKLIGILFVILTVASLTGCGNVIPEMSDEQQALVVEYAVGEVQKYDKNREHKLTELTLEETEEQNAEEEPKKSPVPEETGTGIHEETVTESIGTEEMPDENSFSTIEDIFNMPEMKFTYTGYETDDFYPKVSDGELQSGVTAN